MGRSPGSERSAILSLLDVTAFSTFPFTFPLHILTMRSLIGLNIRGTGLFCFSSRRVFFQTCFCVLF